MSIKRPQMNISIPHDGDETVYESFTVDVMSTGRIRVTEADGTQTYHTSASEISGRLSSVRHEIRLCLIRSSLPVLLASCKWSFPKFETDNNALPKDGKCVYFAFDPRNTDVIKIGQTINLRHRMRSLAEQGTREFYRPVAYCETEYHEVLELALLDKFDEYQCLATGLGIERFHAEPVMNWLREIYREVRK